MIPDDCDPVGTACAEEAAIRQGANARGEPFPATKTHTDLEETPNSPLEAQHDGA